MAADPRFEALERTGVSSEIRAALEQIVEDGDPVELTHVNALSFAKARALDEQEVIGAFLQASRLGLFDLDWTVHCPLCSGMLDAHASPRGLRSHGYYCTNCNASCEVTLDSIVEATFTVNQRVRKVPAHEPQTMPAEDYLWLVHFSTRLAKATALTRFMKDYSLGLFDLAPGTQKTLSLTVEPGMVALFEALTHCTGVLEVSGEPVTQPQPVTFTWRGESARMTRALRPGPVSVVLENATNGRIIPMVHRMDEGLHSLFREYQPYLSAKRLFTHPTFRELFRTDALDIDQKLKVESLTVLFTDLKGSTELYERVGDLAAFDLVRRHFNVLENAVKAHRGSVVKTIGDAVMATFPSPNDGLRAALQMRESLAEFNRKRKHDDLLVKIGLHDGPCLAVMLNERLDYFGQTVNIAARVQGLAEAQAILATRSVLQGDGVSRCVEETRIAPRERRANLKGITGEVVLYEIAAQGS